MTNNGVDLQISILPKVFPLEIGETVPFGHHLKVLLPECTTYLNGFMGWFKALHWAFIKNSKKPTTGKDDDIFSNTNWVPTIAEGNSPGKTILNNANGANHEAYSLDVTPIISTSEQYKNTLLASTEISAASKLDN